MKQSLRVLVVDDDVDIANGTARVLEQAGYTVERVLTGEDGWQVAQERVPDLVLLDRNLPGIDGLEVCRRIKSAPALAGTFVVLASAEHSTSDDQAEGLEAGADGYIARPIANRELLARVAAYARIQQLSQSLQSQATELRLAAERSANAQLATLNLLEDAIHARRDAEAATQALLQSQLAYGALIEQAADAILITGPDRTFRLANASASAMFGYAPEEFVGLPAAAVVTTAGVPQQKAAFQRIALGETIQEERPFRRKDGSEFPGEVRARMTVGGAVLAIIRDITERKQAEASIGRLLEELRAHAETLEILGRCNRAVLASTSRQQMFEQVCRLAVDSGKVKMAWIGMIAPATGTIDPVASAGQGTSYLEKISLSVRPDQPCGRGPVGTALREDRPFWCADFQHDPVSVTWHDLSREYGWSACASLPLHLQGQVLGGLTLYFGDTARADDAAGQLGEEMADEGAGSNGLRPGTGGEPSFDPLIQRLLLDLAQDVEIALERFAAEARIDQLLEEVQAHAETLERSVEARTADLQAANLELDAFASSVTHDLRAPLRTIAGFSATLASRYGEQLDAPGRQYVERISTGASEMSALIDDMLNLAHVTRQELVRQRVDLVALVREIANALQVRDPQRAVRIVVPESVEVDGDPRLLGIALRNLLENAWKFTGQRDAAIIEFGVEPGTPTASRRFFVRDNGAGFDMAFVDKLFTPFKRLHTATEFPGTGIGLATVQRIITRHGGRVWAEATLGQGATFTFTLDGDTAQRPARRSFPERRIDA